MRIAIWIMFVLLLCVGCRDSGVQSAKAQSSLYTDIQNAIQRGDDLNASLANKENGYTFAHRAALDGDIEAMRLLLDHQVDVNVKDRIGATPLHRAVQTGHADVAGLLLENQADINALDNSRASPLFFAVGAESNSEEVVECLIQYGADIHIADESGWTALHWAAFHSNPTAVKQLLDAGEDVNIPDAEGCTPLHVAALYGRLEVAEVLLEHGADPEAKSESGTPVYVAKYRSVPDHVSERGKRKVAELILYYVEKKGKSKYTMWQEQNGEGV